MDKTKTRTSNFRPEETNLLIELAKKYKDLIECKKTDTVSNARKEAAWNKLAVEFNFQFHTDRTAKSLKCKWDGLKKLARKESAAQKLNVFRTDGGASSSPFISVNEKVLSVICSSTTDTTSNCDDGNLIKIELPEPDELHIIDGTDEEQSIDIKEENIDTNEWNSWLTPSTNTPNIDTLSNPTVTTEGEDSVNPTVVNVTRKRKRMPGRISLTRRKEKQVYEKLALKKIELINLQIEILKKEAERKEAREAEKHRLYLEEEERKMKREAEREKQAQEKHELEIKLIKLKIICK